MKCVVMSQWARFSRPATKRHLRHDRTMSSRTSEPSAASSLDKVARNYETGSSYHLSFKGVSKFFTNGFQVTIVIGKGSVIAIEHHQRSEDLRR